MSVSKRAMTVVLMFVLLAVMAIPASAAPAIPLNYCTTVEAHQEAGLATFEVNATGSGRYARLVEYPVTGAPVVIAGPHDFGASATVYQFTHVPLNPARAYQVQTSHTSLTTGYSTTGCVLSPPPLFNQIDRFDVTCTPSGARLEWDMLSEAGVFDYAITQDMEIIARFPAQCPGCMIGASYVYTYTTGAPNGEYGLFPTQGGALAQLTDCVVAHPTAVRLSRFSAK